MNVRIALLITICGLSLTPRAGAWTKAYHAEITEDAYNNSGTFRSYLTSYDLASYLLQKVQDADNDDEKYYVAHLDDASYATLCRQNGLTIIEAGGDAENGGSSDPDRVQHVTSILSYHLPNDQRLHNAVAGLKLSLLLKSGSPTASQRQESMRIFANGLHLLQDYFAHLNAPGEGSTGVAHGVTNLVDTDGDGIADTAAGELLDDIHWDCHSDSGNSPIPNSEREINIFHSPYWHYHADKADCTRYVQVYNTTIEYMQAYAVYENAATFESVLARGTVINGSTTTYIDLLTRVIIDNMDASPYFTTGGSWTTSGSVDGYYMSNYAHDGTSGANASSIWAKWTPSIPIAGTYKIYMRWAASANKASAAPLTIVYNGGTDASKTVNQTTNGSCWNLIGTYALSAGTGNSVKITATAAGYTEADAVMFIRQTY